MKLTPDQFVAVLRATSLSFEQQEIIVEMLPSFSEEKIIELYQMLKEDAEQTAKMLNKYVAQMETAKHKIDIQIENAEKEINRTTNEL